MQPRAVPYSTVARLPVLQCVSTRNLPPKPRQPVAAITAAMPCEPIALFVATSSCCIHSAKAMAAAVSDAAVAVVAAAASSMSACNFFAASRRLTAVGRLHVPLTFQPVSSGAQLTPGYRMRSHCWGGRRRRAWFRAALPPRTRVQRVLIINASVCQSVLWLDVCVHEAVELLGALVGCVRA
jgi:hypothetical protein